MTSQCKVSAHLADDKEVVVNISGGGNSPEEIILQDGEELERSFYDDMVITLKESEKSIMKPTLSFSQALDKLKQGNKVARSGWNGKGMFIFLVNGSKFKVNRAPLLGIYPEGTEINYHAHVDMKTADGQIVPWLCSQTDMLAEDWEVIQ